MKVEGVKLISVDKADIKNGTFEIPENIRIIGSNAFLKCSQELEHIELPNTIRTIAENAFNSCVKLKSIKLPKDITILRQGTFSNCTSLEDVELPNSLIFMNQSVFLNCESLKKINIPKGLLSIPPHTFDGCKSLQIVTIDSELKSILSGAFANCESLKQIFIPKTVTKIKENAFENCVSLKQIELPPFMMELGHSVFKNCKSLESITIPRGLVNISGYTFDGCENLKNVNFINSVININEGAFKDCKSLKKIDIPYFVRIIGDNAFENCINLKNVTMQNKVEFIGKECFKDCKSLKNIDLSTNLTTINDGAFYNCENLKNINIPKSVKNIGSDVFTNCDSLENLFVPDSVLQMNGIYGKGGIYLLRESGGFTLSTHRPEIREYCIDVNGYKNNLCFLTNHWEYRNIILNEQKDPKVSDFYNTYLSYLDNDEADKFLKNHNFKFFKQLEIDSDLPHKADLYGFLFNIGAFEKSIMKNGKKIDYAQKVVGFILEKIAKKEADMQTFSRMGISMKNKGFNSEFTEFFIKYFELFVNIEQKSPGFVANCYNKFEEVQKANTSDHGEQRQLKPSIERFVSFFAFEKFDGVTEETKDIATTVSKYFNTQDAFDNAKEIDEERRKKHIKNNILKSPLKENNPFEKIDETSKKIVNKQNKTLEIFASIASNEFTYEWLEKNDPQNFILGKLCSCCSHLQGAGYGIMHASIVHPNIQNIVIRNGNGEIVAKSTLFVNKMKGYGVCNNVEVRKDVPLADKDKIFKKYLLGIQEFANQYNKEHRFLKLRQINVGMGFNDLDTQIMENCKISKKLFTAIDYAKYGKQFMSHNGDSSLCQYVIWENPDLKSKRKQNSNFVDNENEKN